MPTALILREENIVQQIYFLRDEKVMLDFNLAALYGVETKFLKRAVRRNQKRFPKDFMFVLTRKEYNSLRYQNGTLKRGAHSKYLPFAFTEQGVAMLSGVLNSERAIKVNIAIMRAFVQMRKLLETHTELAMQLKKLESRLDKHDHAIQDIFEAIRQLMEQPTLPRKKIGFKIGGEK
jgi:phage regulator Rha-like protein